MPIKWKLREWLRRERAQTRPTDIGRMIYKRTGYKISVQAIAELLNNPKMLRLETMEAICSTFDCKISDLLEVIPSPYAGLAREAESRQFDTSALTSGIARAGESSSSVGRTNWAEFYPDARSFSSNQTSTK
jgi:putative transcriptional regulator